ncbi:MAG: YSIRK-type signal peptide-containing protein [Peptoniphilaceae bacterium]|nr:YSIRK-type signal peptide-containing protein [Peptoniphilaceae bacterium]
MDSLLEFIKQKKEKSSNRKPKYATRKLSVGLVSSMLGFAY